MAGIGCCPSVDIINFLLPTKKGTIRTIGTVDLEILVLTLYLHRAAVTSVLQNK